MGGVGRGVREGGREGRGGEGGGWDGRGGDGRGGRECSPVCSYQSS